MLTGIIVMTYLEECTKFFAPLDEIQEALRNHEGILGMDFDETLRMCSMDAELVNLLNL